MALSRSVRPRRLPNLMRSGIAIAVSAAVLTPGFPAVAQPVSPDDGAIARTQAEITEGATTVAGLAGEISRSEEEINRLELDIGALRESINKALVDLHDAQATAEQARQAVTASRERLEDIQAEIDAAQGVMDEISRTAYRHGAKSAAVTNAAGGDNAEDALDRQTFLRVNAEEQRSALDELDALRTRQANEESQLRAARDLAEQREREAEDVRADTETQISSVNAQVAEVSAQREQLIADRDAVQVELDRSRQSAAELDNQRREYEEYQAAEAARKDAEEEAAAAAEERHRADAAAEQAEAARRAAEDTPPTSAAAEAAESAPEPARDNRPTAEAESAAGLAAAPYAEGGSELPAAEPADQAAEEAEQARVEAEQAAAREAAAAQLRDAAVAAATEAAAAMVADNTPDHTTLDSPYPSGEDNPDVPIAAVQNPGSSQGSSQPVTPDAPEVELEPVSTFPGVTEQVRETVSGSREEQIETVIARAQSQIGVPYAWGGGDATGPTRGIRDGGVADSFGDYNKVGFDCSGLMVYAFAGIGVALPHYTGYQYNHGTKIDPANMERGDLIFYGPNAEHHVAIYLGDGKMLEAPQSGSAVQVSDVRYSGMSPSAVRLV